MDDSEKSDKASQQENISWGSVVYGFQNSTDPFTLRQLFFIKTFSLVGFVAATALGIINLIDNNYQVGIPDTLSGLVFFLNLVLFSLTKNMQLAKGIMVANLGALLIVILATGGTANTGIYWFFSFPIAAFFFDGEGKRNYLVSFFILRDLGDCFARYLGVCFTCVFTY